MESVRFPRFKRSPAVNPIRLTERDQDILRHVRRHRFLLSDHIQALVPGSRQQILRRLQRLFHHGYLDRPRVAGGLASVTLTLLMENESFFRFQR